jgi:DNA-formamidopyrimidine glycosylase
MPEGPEIKYITNYLNNHIKNKIIKKITINNGRYKKHRPPKNFTNFIDSLPLKVSSVNCYGKFIWWEFENNDITLWNTLGMSGWWNFNEKDKHNNISFYIENDILNFNDVRNFGTIIFNNKSCLQQKLSKFGPDILDYNINKGLTLFKKKIEKKRDDMFIASLLLDQTVASGSGNYIRAEVLYLANISPFRKLKNLKPIEIKIIWNLLQQVGFYYYNKKLGIKLGIIDGKYKFAEYYKRRFLVYMQETDIKGNKIVKQKIKDRTIHYVPTLQK